MDDKSLKHKKKEKKEEVVGEAESDSAHEDTTDTTSDIAGDKDTKDQKVAELEEQLKRAVADYRNLERRSFEEKTEAIRYANKHLIEALLPALDTLFLAGKYTTDESVKLTIGRILEVLRDN